MLASSEVLEEFRDGGGRVCDSRVNRRVVGVGSEGV